MSSRWAVNRDKDAETASQRKRIKDEKRRSREKHRAGQTEQATNDTLVQQNSDQRPRKRQRTESPEHEINNHNTSVSIAGFPLPAQPCGQLDHYEILNNIEEGTYGIVSRARERSSGDIVALKLVKYEHQRQSFPVTALREIQLLRACSHDHILHLREVVTSSAIDSVHLVLDFIEHDLRNLLQENITFSLSETKTLMLQITSATAYLHDHWIIHRDLKTSNLLLNNRGDIKLADFGMARYTADPPPKLTQLVVSLWYRAPELLLGAEEYSFEIDVWSVGCIFAELLAGGKVLFNGKDEIDQVSRILEVLGSPSLEVWPQLQTLPYASGLFKALDRMSHWPSRIPDKFKSSISSEGQELLSAMLAYDPTMRPTAPEILRHPFWREKPRPMPREMLPSFPSKAGQERRRKAYTPPAPKRDEVVNIEARDFEGVFDRKK